MSTSTRSPAFPPPASPSPMSGMVRPALARDQACTPRRGHAQAGILTGIRGLHRSVSSAGCSTTGTAPVGHPHPDSSRTGPPSSSLLLGSFQLPPPARGGDGVQRRRTGRRWAPTGPVPGLEQRPSVADRRCSSVEQRRSVGRRRHGARLHLEQVGRQQGECRSALTPPGAAARRRARARRGRAPLQPGLVPASLPAAIREACSTAPCSARHGRRSLFHAAWPVFPPARVPGGPRSRRPAFPPARVPTVSHSRRPAFPPPHPRVAGWSVVGRTGQAECQNSSRRKILVAQIFRLPLLEAALSIATAAQ